MIAAILRAQWLSMRSFRLGSRRRSAIISILTALVWYGFWTVLAYLSEQFTASAEAIDLIRRCKVVLLGNHDQGAMFDPDGFNPPAERAIFWTRAQLESAPESREKREERWEFLAERPRSVNLRHPMFPCKARLPVHREARNRPDSRERNRRFNHRDSRRRHSDRKSKGRASSRRFCCSFSSICCSPPVCATCSSACSRTSACANF